MQKALQPVWYNLRNGNFARGKENLINQVKIKVYRIAQMNYSRPKHWMKIERNQYFSTHDLS